jgi:hypothetical protein
MAQIPSQRHSKNAENLDWKVSGSSQDMWDKIHTNLLRICKDVPTKSVNSDSGNFENKSARPAVIRAQKNKDKMWKIFNTIPTAINFSIAKHADAKLARIIFEDLTATEKKVIKNLRTVPKPFYAHLNRKKLTKASITSIKTKDKILRYPEDIAEEFAGFFATTFTQESDGPLPPFSLPKKIEPIPPLTLSVEEVGKILQKINPSKAYGPDNIHPYILRSLS